MSKKPALELLTTAADPSAPPRNLGQHGANLWRSILSEYEIDDAPGRELLLQACIAMDRAEQCAVEVARDGVTVDTKFGPKEHPLLKHELASRNFVIRVIGRLGLDVEAIKPTGRPPWGS